MTSFRSNAATTRRRKPKRQRLPFLLLLSLTSATASSQYKSRPSYLDESTFDSSHYTSEQTTATAAPLHDDLWEEEDRILSALALIQEAGTKSYLPKNRSISPSQQQPKPSSPRQRKSSKKRRESNKANDGSAIITSSQRQKNNNRKSNNKSERIQSRSEEITKNDEKGMISSTAGREQQVPKENASPPLPTASVYQNGTKKTALDSSPSSIHPSAPAASTWPMPPQQSQQKIPTSISQQPPTQKRATSSLAASTTRTTPGTTKPVVPAGSAAARRREPVPSHQQPVSTPVSKVSSSTTTTPWIRKFLASRPKDVLLPVPREYISDGFNLAQLAPIIERIGFQAMGEDAVDIAKQLVQLPQQQQTSYPVYRLALQLILLLNEDDSSSILQHPFIPPHAIQQAAEALYLLVHTRFVSSPRGLDALRRILGNSPVFGRCPRVSCRGIALLPYGSCDDYTSNIIISKHKNKCQRYCPCCGEIWNFWETKTDGCAWGPSLCHLLLLTHGSEIYSTTTTTTTTPTISHSSRPMIMGFQIHPATTWGRPLSHQSMTTQ